MAAVTEKPYSASALINGSVEQQNGQPPLQLALNNDFISNQQLNLNMKSDYLSSDATVTNEGTPLFKIDSKSFSMSHQKHIIDCRTGQELFTITKKPWSRHWRYSAEIPAGSGNKIFETETSTALFKGATTSMTFGNAAKGGEQETLTMKIRTLGGEMEIMWKGKRIGTICRHSFKMRAEYDIATSPGVDPLLVVVLAVVTDDRRRTRNNAAAGGGGGGGGA